MIDPGTFRLYLITDRGVAGGWDRLLSVVEEALRGGARAVQLRERNASAAELYPLAREMRALTARFNAALLINDRVDVALVVGAEGVHLGRHSLPPAVVRQRFGRELCIGVSTHDPVEVDAAAAGGADFVTFGPVYATPSKAAHGEPLGVEALGAVCERSRVPVFALGGVTPDRRREVLAAGATGCAVISAVLAAPDPYRAAVQLVGEQP